MDQEVLFSLEYDYIRRGVKTISNGLTYFTLFIGTTDFSL